MSMNINYLTESINAKYSLNEAYNASFPDWLKGRLNKLVQYHQEKDTAGNRVHKNHSPQIGPTPDYTIPKGDPRWGTQAERSLFNQALEAGVDFQNTEVIEGEVPTKRTDSRLKAPNIPIWGFQNGQVYIPGMNDNEKNEFMPFNSTYYNYAFKYLPVSQLINYAVHFAHIDGSTLDANTYMDKKNQRQAIQNEIVKGVEKYPTAGMYRKGDPDQFKRSFYNRTNWTAAGFDKSGYPIDPQRYVDKLANAAGAKIFQHLDQRYQDLMDARDDITAAMHYYDPFEDSGTYTALADLMKGLLRAITAYNQILEQAKDIADAVENNRITENEAQKVYVSLVKSLRNDSYWKQVQETGDDIFLAGADWLD